MDLRLACVQTSPLPQKKTREETFFSWFFLREGERLYTGYLGLQLNPSTMATLGTEGCGSCKEVAAIERFKQESM